MTAPLPTPSCTYQKFIDTDHMMPGTGKPFIKFEPPVYDGNSILFLGDNEEREGLFAMTFGGDLEKISDSATPLPDLDGPPTSAGTQDAYVQNTSGTPSLAPCSSVLTFPRPVFVDGFVAFFAANWSVGQAGIFLFDRTSGTVRSRPLVSSVAGTFQSGIFGQPTAGPSGTVWFPGMGDANNDRPGNTPAPGLFSVSVYDPAQAVRQPLDLLNAKTPQGTQVQAVGNPKVWPCLPQDQALFFGSGSDGNEAIYRLGQDGLQTVISAGYSFGPGPISSGANTFYREIGLAPFGNLLAFRAELTTSGGSSVAGLIALAFGEEPLEPVLITTGISKIPGAASETETFDGNDFATPPATDGTRVAFCGNYFGSSIPDPTGLFVWNARTRAANKILKTGDIMDLKQIQTVTIGSQGFVNGKLVARIGFADNSQGLYLLDLSDF
ncbi:hypothetical protein [Roseibium sp. RKSG952]|uniref:hypothetical protein n=1 Tax=Roseibium sp. RKSG952 TaxID=2529384 RepID=UPI0012BD35EF|nr:hypothetical protein [Roseibium sp. RKSG952]MTH96941.1 hypothetical protein [Roseibium sp. RKSG952]